MIITYTDGSEVNLGRIEIDNSIETDSGLILTLLSDGTYGVKAGSSYNASSLSIPSTYNGIAITRILDNGFRGCSSLSDVTIPESIAQIGAYAFYESGLTSATLEGTSTWINSIGSFDYILTNTWYNNGSTDRYATVYCFDYTYDITNSANAAKALTGPVSLVTEIVREKSGYSGETTINQYETDFSWFAGSWVRQ